MKEIFLSWLSIDQGMKSKYFYYPYINYKYNRPFSIFSITPFYLKLLFQKLLRFWFHTCPVRNIAIFSEYKYLIYMVSILHLQTIYAYKNSLQTFLLYAKMYSLVTINCVTNGTNMKKYLSRSQRKKNAIYGVYNCLSYMCFRINCGLKMTL